MISADLERQIMNRSVVVSTTRDLTCRTCLNSSLPQYHYSRFNTDGTIRKCNKSQLLREMEKVLAVEELADIEEEILTIMDFMVVLRMICTDTSKCQTFGDLSNALLHTIFSMFEYGSNVGVVFDRYDVVGDSIKACERARRGQVVMQEIKIHNDQTPLPKHRSKFLSNP